MWSAATAAALLAAAAWLRGAQVEYLAAAGLATAVSLAAALRARDDGSRRQRHWQLAGSLLAAATILLLAVAHGQIATARDDWRRHESALLRGTATRLQRELERIASELRATARDAVAIPSARDAAFAALADRAAGAGERGVVVYDGAVPVAWSGMVRVETDTLRAPLGVTRTAFYTVLHAVARANGRRAVATALLHARPPASNIARPLDALIVESAGVRGFDFDRGVAPDPRPHARLALADGGPPLVARVLPVSRDEHVLHLLERARVRGSVALGLALAAFVAALWRARRRLRIRLAALAVALLCVGIVPLNTLSNTSRLFDPALYFAPLGGPFTGSAAALGLTGAILLLGLLAVLRSSARAYRRWPALGLVLVIAALGPYLLRNLARGVVPPAGGVSPSLWLAWETALFLAGVSLVLAGASAGRTALGARRGLPAWVAPAIAATAAIAAPALWEAPGRWPAWFPLLWAAAIAALAFTRRSTRFVAAAAIVASLGASTLVWGSTTRKRVELAQRDVESLRMVDEYALALLNRFAETLGEVPPPRTRAELLARYVVSDLAAADYPVELAAWEPEGVAVSAVSSSLGAPVRAATIAAVVDEARRAGRPVLREALSEVGVALMLAVPSGRSVTSVTVLPRTRLVSDDPYAPLLGVAVPDEGEPPYTLSVTGADSLAAAAGGRLWTRAGDELHGDWLLRTAGGTARVHAEVELRSMGELIQRGVLVVILNLTLVALLWALSALADGGYARWVQARRRHWTRSYRSRLTLVLFAFFVLPAAAFAAWSYRQLRADDRQSRELLLRETLRGVTDVDALRELPTASRRVGAPILVFEGGALRATSDTLYDALAPFGRLLAPAVFRSLALSDEVTASATVDVGDAEALLGYRAVTDERGRRLVIAAPARAGEEALDRRRRDLGVLVLFTTALGALAALALSGVAARQFARPVGELRDAALAIAGGDAEPSLGTRPPAEFLPVYSAFRRMASDLSASRGELVEARRRTEAVLRTVASGVVAVDGDGRVSLANPRAETLLGRSPVAGAPVATLDVPEVARPLTDFLASGADELEFEAEVGRRQLRGRLTRLSRGGAVLTLDDVTELAHAQRVLAWGEMARQVAHEIKNPLTPIRLGVQHLRRAFASGRGDFPTILEQNAGRILAEIDRLDEIARSFSRYGTTPSDQPPPEVVDVAPVVRGVAELERLGETGVQWTVEGADRPALAFARDGELRDVLVNVAENARLAGARNVSLTVARENGDVRVEIRDDGEGIAPEALPRIFEPHFSTRTSGSGLGLAISRRIIDGWGGSIGVESEVGRGTTVRVVLRGAPDAGYT